MKTTSREFEHQGPKYLDLTEAEDRRRFHAYVHEPRAMSLGEKIAIAAILLVLLALAVALILGLRDEIRGLWHLFT